MPDPSQGFQGVRMVLVIRRLGCPACDRIHHELPDCLVPYKRYDVESIEAGILEGTASAVAADESTIARWRRWFAAWVVYAVGCLRALQTRAGLQRCYVITVDRA